MLSLAGEGQTSQLPLPSLNTEPLKSSENPSKWLEIRFYSISPLWFISQAVWPESFAQVLGRGRMKHLLINKKSLEYLAGPKFKDSKDLRLFNKY